MRIHSFFMGIFGLAIAALLVLSTPAQAKLSLDQEQALTDSVDAMTEVLADLGDLDVSRLAPFVTSLTSQLPPSHRPAMLESGALVGQLTELMKKVNGLQATPNNVPKLRDTLSFMTTLVGQIDHALSSAIGRQMAGQFIPKVKSLRHTLEDTTPLLADYQSNLPQLLSNINSMTDDLQEISVLAKSYEEFISLLMSSN